MQFSCQCHVILEFHGNFFPHKSFEEAIEQHPRAEPLVLRLGLGYGARVRAMRLLGLRLELVLVLWLGLHLELWKGSDLGLG